MGQHSGIGVLDKALVVLHTVAESPCGLAELCDRTGLPRATAHRLAAGLEAHRLLGRDGDGRWQIGPAVTELADRVDDPLRAAAAAVLPRLREITGESAQLYRREGFEVGRCFFQRPKVGLLVAGQQLPEWTQVRYDAGDCPAHARLSLIGTLELKVQHALIGGK